MLGNPLRVTAWTASIVLHALALLAVIAWMASKNAPSPSSRAIDTRETRKDVPFQFEFDLPASSQSINPGIRETKYISPEMRIASAIAKMKPGNLAPEAETGTGKVESPSPSPTQSAGVAFHPALNYHGKSIVYVMDCSGSMSQAGRWNKACESVLASLELLSEGMNYQIVLYDSRSRTFDGGNRLRPVRKEEFAQVKKILHQQHPEGASQHAEGLRLALNLAADGIYLLTDADDFTPKVVQEVSGLFRHQWLNVILFGEPEMARDSPLQRLTKARRGGIYFVGKGRLEQIQ